MESLIALCLLNSPALHPLRTSSSLVFQILPPNPNFISFLHWKNFLMESSIVLFLILRKNLKLALWPKAINFQNLPITRNLYLTNLSPLVIYNDECWKWSFHFVVIDGWDGTEVSVLNWMLVLGFLSWGSRNHPKSNYSICNYMQPIVIYDYL